MAATSPFKAFGARLRAGALGSKWPLQIATAMSAMGAKADIGIVRCKGPLSGFALVWWTPKLKREERLEVSDDQTNSEAEASVQAVQF